jgi:Mg-chelatase subunit ChlD
MSGTPPSPRNWRNETTSPGPGASPRKWKNDTVPANQPAWQQGGGPTPRGGGQRAWQQAPPAQQNTGRWWTRRNKLMIAVVVFLALSGVAAALIYLLLPVRPPHVILAGSDNALNLAVAPNPEGEKALRELQEIMEEEGRKNQTGLKIVGGDLESAETWSTWLQELQGIFTRSTDKVLMFVTAHGGADTQGAFLIPQNADPRDRGTLIRMSGVIEELAALPRKTKKLLILDVTEVPTNWHLGQFHNDFARGLKQLQSQIDQIDNLVVICSSAEDQRSWTSELWGTTVFAHYLLEGLQGNAQNLKGRVTARGLFDYTQEKVSQWVRANRNATQTPMILSSSKANPEDIVVVVARKGSPSPPVTEPLEVPASLVSRWEQCWELGQRRPSPATFAPHLWRQYLETMLRYEYLVRAGDRAGADKIGERLTVLKGEIDRAEVSPRPVNSLDQSLALALAFRESLPEKDRRAVSERFNALWDRDAAAGEFALAVPQLRGEKVDAQRDRLIRMEFSRLLLQQVIDDPTRNLARAVAVQKAIDSPDRVRQPRPAEAHFLVMLQKDLSGRAALQQAAPPADLIRTALQVRLRAEEAAVGIDSGSEGDGDLPVLSEAVFPWTRELVTRADQKRRAGEDRLFASDEKSWEQAGKNLEEARGLYQQAQQAALQVRRALAVRAQTLAELPYYSHWLALREEADDRGAEIYTLWGEVHALDRLLSVPNTSPPTLAQQADKVAGGFAAIRNAFDRHCESIRELEVVQKRWHETEHALLVPFIKPELRRELLDNSHKIAFALQTAEEKGEGSEPEPFDARAAARRQARMALAVIGEEWFDTRAEGPDFDRVSRWVDEPDWLEPIARVGEQFAERWAQLSREVQAQTTKATQTGDLATVRKLLAEAARWARHLDGAAIPWLGGLDPLNEYRRIQMHDFLCWQAERTYLDYWADEEEPSRPYYRFVGENYVADARPLAGEKLDRKLQEQRLVQVTELEKKLTAPGELRVTSIDRVTSESALDGVSARRDPAVVTAVDDEPIVRTYRIEASAGVPEGLPVVWARAGKYLKPDAADRGRQILEDFRPGKPEERTYRLEVEKPVRPPRRPTPPDRTEHGLEGWFRGHVFSAATPIHIYRLPDVVAYQQEAPTLAGVAVQAPEEVLASARAGNNALVIVLDCSGSMGVPEDAPPGTRSRLDRVLDALKQVLPELPRGTRVSLRAFSHKGFTDPDRSELIWSSQSWDDPGKKTEELMPKVRRLEPAGGYTPLLETMREAKADFPAGFSGTRTMLVLTDGVPQTGPDQFPSPARIRAEMTDLFKGKGILLQILGVEVGATRAEVKKAFQKAVEEVGGTYYTVERKAGEKESIDRLVASLRKAVLPLRYWVEHFRTGKPPTEQAREGEDITRISLNPSWVQGLPASVYNLEARVSTSEKPIDRSIRLDQGEFLLLNLRPRGAGYYFERALYAEQKPQGLMPEQVRRDRNQSWMFAVHQNQPTPNRDLQLMTTLEDLKKRSFPGGHLQHVKPTMIWYEVSPAEDQGDVSFALRFGTLYRYPAPAWGLDVLEWPRRTSPVLKVWWTDNEFTLPERDHPFARRLEKDFGLGMKPKAFKVPFKSGEVTEVILESIRLENRVLADRAEKPERTIPCLVIRLRYPVGKPFLVYVPNSPAHEDRVYLEAGRYTGIFYNWTEAEAREKLSNLVLISLKGFKEYSEKEDFSMDLKLGTPEYDYHRPPPITIR